jgi:hypothetical protein
VLAAPSDLAIIHQALEDVIGRLDAAPQTPLVQQLSARALSFRRRVGAWAAAAPANEVCAAVRRAVLDMNIAVMQSGLPSDED